jgi:hypothetical protein
MSPDSLVGVVMAYGLDGWDLIPTKAKKFFSTP